MNKRQEDKLNMYDSVLAHYNQNETLIEPMVALQNAYIAFKAVVAAINSTGQQQMQSAKGHTISKADNKSNISSFGVQVAGALYAWAVDIKNPVLSEKVKTAYSTLFTMRDEELANACRNYHGIAAANQAALTDYGLTKEVIDSFKLAIDNYQNSVPAPRNAAAQRKAYREKLAELFKEADNILKNKVDNLSLPLKQTAPDYLKVYQINRRIVNSGTNSTALSIIVKDAATGQPITKAMVRMDAEQVEAEAMTDKQGKATVRPIPMGIYTVTVSKEGHVPQTTSEVKTLLGKTVTLNFALKEV